MRLVKIFLVFLALAAGYLYYSLRTVASQETEAVTFEVKVSEPFGSVAAALEKEGLIHSATVLAQYARLRGIDKTVRAGRYKIDPQQSPVAILNFLASPAHGEIALTIPEGSTIFDIDRKLAQLQALPEGQFLAFIQTARFTEFEFLPPNGKPEGYLFPDTYFIFANNFSPADLVKKMLRNFGEKVTRGLSEPLLAQKRALNEVIIIASILEKEVKTDVDLPVVAGILWKRLDKNWPLQADATLLYGKTLRALRPQDMQYDSPYNTYTRIGLPAGPIGNPGIKMIRAAIAPQDSDYWFYLTDAAGIVHYAKTNEEHEKNKQKYL